MTRAKLGTLASPMANIAEVVEDKKRGLTARITRGEGADEAAIGRAGEARGHVTSGVSNPHGLVYALAGDDRVTGGELTDLLYGGAGGDRLEGGAFIVR